MIGRLGAASLGLIFCLASVFAPDDGFALGGGGGGGGGHGSGSHGGGGLGGRGSFGGRLSLPSGFRSPAARSVIAESPRAIPSRLREHHAAFGVPLRHERGFGLPLFLPGGFFPYGQYYGAGDTGQYYAPVPFGDPDRSSYSDQPPYGERDNVTGAIPGFVNPVVVYRPGCRTQTVTVPSEEGGERSITIVRC